MLLCGQYSDCQRMYNILDLEITEAAIHVGLGKLSGIF